MKKIIIILAAAAACWVFFHHPKAHWQGQLAPGDPSQNSDNLPSSWTYKDFTVTPRAHYHIKAVILSKHHYWGEVEVEDRIAYYDLALGWGPMSDASVINRLDISQGGRWYNYSWQGSAPIPLDEIISHSANNHIIAADKDVLDAVAHFKRYDVVDLEGYLVDVESKKKDWSWHTSLSRTDFGGGSCELFWVNNALDLSL
ncbi:MAG: hypothetical protein KGK03_08870 [Candidatus Omnitrophica bacterium]|nr:hypothetical protein [Candidatus Omnitrophota bacterium]MDE2223167.1 hypothetical protein [Candidatus Omnitrophota bacterium]